MSNKIEDLVSNVQRFSFLLLLQVYDVKNTSPPVYQARESLSSLIACHLAVYTPARRKRGKSLKSQ